MSRSYKTIISATPFKTPKTHKKKKQANVNENYTKKIAKKKKKFFFSLFLEIQTQNKIQKKILNIKITTKKKKMIERKSCQIFLFCQQFL